MLELLRAFEFRTEDEGIDTALVDEEHLNHLCLRTLTISILNISSNTAFYSITKANVLSDSIIRSLVPQRITHVFAAEKRLTILVLLTNLRTRHWL